MKKRMNLLPTLALCLFLLPATAGAEFDPTTKDLSTLRNELNTDNEFILLGNDIYVNDNDTLIVANNVTLYLNGNSLTSSSGKLHIQGGSLTLPYGDSGTTSSLYLDSGNVTLPEGRKVVGTSGKTIENVGCTGYQYNGTLTVTAGNGTDTVATNDINHVIKIDGMEYCTNTKDSTFAYQLTVDRNGTVTQLNGDFNLKTRGTSVLVGQGSVKVENGSDTGYVTVKMNGAGEGNLAIIYLWNGGTAIINGTSYTETGDPDGFLRLGLLCLTTDGKIKYAGGTISIASTAPAQFTARDVEYQAAGNVTVDAGKISLTSGYLNAAPGAVVALDGAVIENTGTGQLSFQSSSKNQFLVMNGNGSAKVNGVALSRIGVAHKFQVESGVVTRALTAEEHLSVEGVLYTARDGGATLTIAQNGGVTWSGSYFIEYASDEPSYTLITEGGKTLADAGLTADPTWPAGTLGWVDSEGALLPDSTIVTANAAYTWRFTPSDTSCYRILEDTVILYSVSSSDSSSSSGSSSSSSSTTSTTAKQNPDGSTTVSVSNKDAKSGETVTLPVEVNTEDPSEINVNIPKNSSVTVEIPVENVTPGTVVVIVDEDGNETVVATTGLTENGVTVTLTENCTIKVIENAKDFDDVPENSYYEDAVAWASAREITGGVGGNNFGAENDCGRAQLVTFLWRAAGQPEVDGAPSFSDVEENSYYTDAVKWAASLGIVTGYDSGLFGTDDTITREQMAVILYRFAQKTGLDTTQGSMAVQEFSDYEEISDYAVAAMQWAVNSGVMQGYAGALMPTAECTRAQIVTMLYRLLGK